MTDVEFMPNDKVLGFGISPTIEKPGSIPAVFPTKPLARICMPTKEVGKEILDKMMIEFDKTTGFVKYLVELGEVW